MDGNNLGFELPSSHTDSEVQKELMGSVSLPKRTVTRLKESGAQVINHGSKRAPLYSIGFVQNSPAHHEYIGSCTRDDGGPADRQRPDPLVRLTPPDSTLGVFGIIPQEEDQWQIWQEANAVVTAYAVLSAVDFASGAPVPRLGPPVAGLPGLGVQYHHSAISAEKVVERISDGPGCPVISNQASGVVLCTIIYHYSNALVGIHIVKS